MAKIRKIHKLEIEPDFAFRLIGISSHENDYKLSWAINAKLKLNLTRTTNLVIALPREGPSQEFSCYFSNSRDEQYQFHLLSNKCENGNLIPELNNIDYFIKISGEFSDKQLQKLIDGLKETGSVLATFVLQPGILKSRNRLLF